MGAAAPRRTNRERSEETREKLLDATLVCLARSGFAGATTGEICRLAGLSRGAHLYHFRTREDLIAAAVDHLFDRRAAELRDVAGKVPEGTGRARAVIDYVWEFARGESGAAWIELAVAARTNAALRERLLNRWDRFEQVMRATFEELFPVSEYLRAASASAPFFVFALLQGAALDRGVVGDRKTVTSVVESLQGLASLWSVSPSSVVPGSKES